METHAATLDPASDGGLPMVFADAVLACKILIIDDEAPNIRLLERVLTRAGFENFVSTTDSREAAALFADFQPDLVLTDWLMPGVDGCALIGQVRALTATDDYLPIVVLTADITPPTRQRALTTSSIFQKEQARTRRPRSVPSQGWLAEARFSSFRRWP